MARTSMDPLDSVFTINDMLTQHAKDISWQFMKKIAENTGYCYSKLPAMIGFNNLLLEHGVLNIITANKDYIDAYVRVVVQADTDAFVLPLQFDLDTVKPRFMQLGTAQDMIDGNNDIHIASRALVLGGGFTIQNDSADTDYYICGFIEKLRLISSY